MPAIRDSRAKVANRRITPRESNTKNKRSTKNCTVYNCLKKFRNCGLIKQIETSKDTAVFDTNTHQHHHFLNEETGELIDIEDDEINLKSLPKIPQGYFNNGVEVLIKLKKQD